MKTSSPFRIAACLFVLVIAVWGCSDDEVAAPDEGSTVFIQLKHVVGVQDLLVDDVIRYQNAAGNQYSVQEYHYYISDITLHTAGGETFGTDDVHFVDASAARAETHRIRLDGVPPGDYVSVSFTYGLNAEKNVTGYLENNTDNADMEWPEPMGGGYHYMELQGRWRYSGNPDSLLGYTTHTGRRFMPSMGDTYPHHHFFEVNLEMETLHVPGDNVDNGMEIEVTLDANGWYQDPVTYDFESLPQQMIMPLLEPQEWLQANGPSCFAAAVVKKN